MVYSQESSSEKKKRILFILNPASGKGDEKKSSTRLKLIHSLLRKQKIKTVVTETTLKRTATSIAKKAINDGISHIVVCGGDGTIMEVVEACVGTKVQLGVIPLGTGNLFAQNLKIPLDIEEAFSIALSGKKTRIDVGKVNGSHFTIMAGVGLDAAMLKGANREMKNSFGILAYIVSATKNIFKPRTLYEVKIDKKKPFKTRAKSIMIANMAEITAGIKVVPTAHPQTGTLKIGILKTHSVFSWLELLFNAAKTSIKDSDHYSLLEGKHIEIEFLNGKRIYECDGNLFPATDKLEVDIYPLSLNVMVPSKRIRTG